MAKLPADKGARDCQNIMLNNKAVHHMRDARRLEERSGNHTQREITRYEKLNQESPVIVTKINQAGKEVNHD